MTIPFAGRYPPALCSHLLEFEDGGGGVRLAHELDDGGEYGVVLTTGGGLWRYRLGDRVRAEGRVGGASSLRLVGRADRVVDRFGEKLSDGFVTGVLADLAPGAPFAMLAPDGPAYALFIEGSAADDFAGRLERALCENPHYRHCRNLGQLAAARVVPVAAGAYGRFAARLVEGGTRLGDVKPAALDSRDGWRRWLDAPPPPS